MDNLLWYLSGYADGEGCFCISFSKSKRHILGWEVRPSFSVSQNYDRIEILKLYKKMWGCGHIRPDRSDKTFKYEARSISDLQSKVIPHFRKYPLQSSKKHDFELFAEICDFISKGKHRTAAGFVQIAEIAFQMNSSGKRKYSLKEMMV